MRAPHGNLPDSAGHVPPYPLMIDVVALAQRLAGGLDK
ncbi:hypothetical protein SLI_5095 [Streptomyces lividans 1326]|uniref:Uncharacterized protein n=1 Tax=Streptomyces lividans 1326 TaxID=1200984 RepID=A0A7U9HDG9_STRLI|nr:hypothetical protein SLI_5095 [Streptomyces lividans 1326]